MTTLTESIVLSRSRADDLKSVRKLNCWGSELGDVSLIQDMKNVEVLSLSVNKIKTLADFAHCPNLQELYIRKNEIRNLGDVYYLKDLKKLRSLWLADNPCSEVENYRLSVLKTLPNLQKLDNITVKPEEVQNAMIYGDTLTLRKESPAEEKIVEKVPSPPPRHVSSRRPEEKNRSDLDSEPVRDENRNISNESFKGIPNSESLNSLEISSIHKTQFPSSPGLLPSESQYEANTQNQPQAFQAKVQTLVEHSRTPGHQQAHVEQNQQSTSPFENASLPSQHHSFDGIVHTCYEHNSSPAENGHRNSVTLPAGHGSTHMGIPRSHSSGDRSSPTRAFTGRGKNRNSNILSAVLCLIKELDYANLEVVETAVQCRMLELEDYVSP